MTTVLHWYHISISIHALLAESDLAAPQGSGRSRDFYPRSPCGERPKRFQKVYFLFDFYPRSPCGERPTSYMPAIFDILFLSTLSLRRATGGGLWMSLAGFISIHALLAESDFCTTCLQPLTPNFYPRSPCGERPIFAVRPYDAPIFLSTLSLRRATHRARSMPASFPFLSTLSLRRATVTVLGIQHRVGISIHALLAESDATMGVTVLGIQHNFYPRSPCGERHNHRSRKQHRQKFLSTLSLRRATLLFGRDASKSRYFYPRSPCGERHSKLAYTSLIE